MASSVSSRFARWCLGLEPCLPRILVLDGGVSTHLGDTFRYRELWSSSLLLNDDDDSGTAAIRQGHLDWLRAGANVLSTVTYQCHYESALWPSKTIELDTARVDRMWSDAIRIGQAAVKEHEEEQMERSSPLPPHFLLVSSGCYGAALSNGAEYTGNYGTSATQDVLMDFHRRKLQRVRAIDKDLVVAIETVPSLAECEALRELLLSTTLDLPSCTVSFACRNESELNDGTPLAKALTALADVPRLVGWGVNCCPPQYVAALIRTIACHPPHDRALLVYPNAGEDWDAKEEAWVSSASSRSGDVCDATIEHLMAAVKAVAPDRNLLVGGCCRTTPDTIRKLQSNLQELLRAEQQNLEYGNKDRILQ